MVGGRPGYRARAVRVPQPSLRRGAGLPLACAILGGVLTLLLWMLLVPGIDAPSHLFQTWLFRHGGFDLYNNYWYAGRYEFVNYSMLYYALAASVGQLGVLVPAAGLMTGCFALVCRREWGEAVRGPCITFAVTAPFIMMVGGTYPFMAGTAAALAALVLLQHRRTLAFSAAVLVTLAFSPLSFSLLCAVLAGVLLGQSRPLQAALSHRAAFVAVVVAFLVGVFVQRAFPTEGWYPYDPLDAAIVLVFSLAGLWVAGSHAQTRSMRALFAAYLALNLIAFLLKGPIGSNPSRLFAIAGAPLLWLTANLNPRRPRLVVFPLIALAVAVQVGPKVRDAYSAYRNSASGAAYWQPVHDFVHDHAAQIAGYRVDSVATWGHWEAYYVAKWRVPLARGWFRQEDFPQNGSLYSDDMTPAPFQTWLRSLGVRYVMLPDAPLDYSSAREAQSASQRAVWPRGRPANGALDVLRAAGGHADRDRAGRTQSASDVDRPAADDAVGVRPRPLSGAHPVQPVPPPVPRGRLPPAGAERHDGGGGAGGWVPAAEHRHRPGQRRGQRRRDQRSDVLRLAAI